MLPGAHRLRDGDDFRRTIRRGTKAASPTVVTHLATGSQSVTSVGVVVNKQVGGAVVRNRVKRRLRHLMRERLDLVPDGSHIVIRALPAAAREGVGQEGTRLAADLDSTLAEASRRIRRVRR